MLISIEKYMRNQQEKTLWILAQILAGFLMRTIFSPTLLLLLSSSLQFLDERAFTLGSLASWYSEMLCCLHLQELVAQQKFRIFPMHYWMSQQASDGIIFLKKISI